MTVLMHCDGPFCDETMDPEEMNRKFGDPAWLRVQKDGESDLHFHSKKCMREWTDEPKD